MSTPIYTVLFASAGPPGAQGPQGAQGLPGAQGAQGNPGAGTVFDWSGIAGAITTAEAASGGGSVSDDVLNFTDLGVVSRLHVVANSNTVNSTIRIFADAAHLVQLYEAVAVDCFTSPYEDLIPFHIRDDDATTSFHYEVVNDGANNSTYTLTLQAVGE